MEATVNSHILIWNLQEVLNFDMGHLHERLNFDVKFDRRLNFDVEVAGDVEVVGDVELVGSFHFDVDLGHYYSHAVLASSEHSILM